MENKKEKKPLVFSTRFIQSIDLKIVPIKTLLHYGFDFPFIFPLSHSISV